MMLRAQALSALCDALKARPELELKRDVRLPARMFGARTESAWFPHEHAIPNGDDTAALPDRDGYVLFAAEGIRPELVSRDPWFAGFCSVMVNLSDVAAMGGRPWAVVDVLFSGSDAELVLAGMRDASRAFGVPIVGGHTARVAEGTLIAVAVLGRARRLISSFHARPGQALLGLFDLRGEFRGGSSHFDAATTAPPDVLRRNLSLLPELAEAELVAAGKDVSMAGLCGSIAMLLETSNVGATLCLDDLPAPPEAEPLCWLTAFPSFAFVLTAEPDRVPEICRRSAAAGLVCGTIGTIDASRQLWLHAAGERALYADFSREELTGFGA
jgi:hypothetical protein